MKTFIFQSRPDESDLRKSLKIGSADTWNVTRYSGRMSAGDRVLFWLAGDPSYRGLHGWGSLTSEAYLRPEWSKHGVDVVYKGAFSPPVRADEIKSDPSLRHLLIFRAPSATNFVLSDQEARQLTDFLRVRGHKVGA